MAAAPSEVGSGERAAQLRESSSSRASMSGGLAPVDMQNLTGHERGAFKIQNAVNDVADLAYPADGMKRGQAFALRETRIRLPARASRPPVRPW